MSGRFSALAQALVPQKLSGRLIYRLSRSRRRWLKNLLITGFGRLYDVDLSETESADPDEYADFNAFFTRALKPGARPLAGGDETIVSPVDGRLTQFGRIEGGRLLQAKGRAYSLEALLVEPPELIEAYRGGSFLTVYLAPHNYHRVHAPVAGSLDRGRYIPGRRFCVNESTTAHIDRIFCRNERVALWLSTPIGYAVVVMIGALNVASLSTVLTGEIDSGAERFVSPDAPRVLARGDELGRFNLGSTIVMLFPRGTVEWLKTLAPGQSVKMGQTLGRITGRGAATDAGAE